MSIENGLSISPEVARDLNEDLKQFPDFKPQATFVFSLSQGRNHAIEIIDKNSVVEKNSIFRLLESGDFVEQDAALYFLTQVEDIKKMFGQDIDRLVEIIGRDCGNELNANSSKIYYKLLFEFNGEQAIEQSSLRLSEIKQGLRSNQDGITNKDARDEAGIAYALRYGGQEALPELEKVILDSVSFEAKIFAIHSMSTITGGKDILLKLLNDGKMHDLFDESPAETEAKKVLSESIKSDHTVGLDELKDSWKLITSRKPLLSSGDTELLNQRFTALGQIVQILENEFGDEFSGISIVGSTARGYAHKFSDLDAMILGSNPQIADRFKVLAGKFGIEVCRYCYFQINDQSDDDPKHVSELFTGVYVGNREKLLNFQQKHLLQIDQTRWDKIRNQILRANTDLTKLAYHLGVKDEEEDKLKTLIELNTVPPPLEEARIAIKRRKTHIKETQPSASI